MTLDTTPQCVVNPTNDLKETDKSLLQSNHEEVYRNKKGSHQPVIAETTWETITSSRWILAYVGFFCYVIVNALKMNIGIAMICMIKTSNNTDNQNSSYNHQNTSQYNTGEIIWSKSMQGWVLSAFYYGYIVAQLPAGYLIRHFGGKMLALLGLMVFASVTMLIPVTARLDGEHFQTSAALMIVLRLVQGISSAFVGPALYSLWGVWAPPLERSKLLAFCNTGRLIGNTVMLATGGYFCTWKEFDNGWPSAFYFVGAISLSFCPLWYFTVYDSPNKHPRIREKERIYINSSINQTTNDQSAKNIPWQAFFTSTAVWAIIVAHVCYNFGDYTLVTKIAAFMQEVLHFDIQQNGLLSAIPHLAMFILANLAAQIIDKMRSAKILTTKLARKICTVTAFIVPGALLVATGYLSSDTKTTGVTLLILAISFTGLSWSGVSSNHVDIAPRFAGEIFAISNTFACIPGMIAPSIINKMTPNGEAEEWRKVFYVWAAVYVFGAVFYAAFAEGDVQNWAKKCDHEEENQPMQKLDE